VAKPVVDGLEKDLAGRARVVRLNVMDPLGMSAARQFSVIGVPAFFVLDGQGKVVQAQAGFPNRDKLRGQVQALLAK